MKKMVVTAAAVAVLGLGSSIFSQPAYANTVDNLEDKQSDIQNDRESVKADLSEAEAQIADVLFDLKELNSDMDRIDNALKDNEAQMENTKETISETKKEIKTLDKEIEKLEEIIEQRYEILKDRIASYQKSGGDISYLEVVMGSKSFSDFISRVSAVSKIADSDQKLVEQQEADKAEVEEKKQTVKEKLDEQEQKKADLDEMAFIIKEQKEQQKKNKQELKDKEANLTAKKAELESEDSNLAALEAEIRADIDAASRAVEAEANDAAETEVAEAANTTIAAANMGSNSNSNTNSSQTAASTSSNSEQTATSNTSSSKKTAKKQSKPKKQAPKASGNISAAINAGKKYIGNSSYVWGGGRSASDIAAGRFDCSGFVSWAYSQAGISVPASTGALAGVGTKVSASSMQPGDMVFFNTNGTNGHVGIYMGGGKFIGSQSSNGVEIVSMSNPYWSKHFSGHVRRVN